MLKSRSKSPLTIYNNQNTETNSEQLTRDQQVALLRRKLVQTHNKLLEQLDFNKQQQLRILELTRQNHQSRGGQNVHHDPSRSDLEAMRTRILAQMLEKNKARDQLKVLSTRLYQKEEQLAGIQEELKTIKHDQGLLEKRYQILKGKYQSQALQLDRQSRSNESLRLEVSSSKSQVSELEKLLNKEQIHSRQTLEVNKQLSTRLTNLQLKLDDFEEQNLSLRNKFLLDTKEKSLLHTKTLQIQKLTSEINRLMIQLKEKEHQLTGLRHKTSATPKKRDFDETRQLILKLQEAEMHTRSRHSPKHQRHYENSSETIKQFSSRKKDHHKQVTFEHSIYADNIRRQ